VIEIIERGENNKISKTVGVGGVNEITQLNKNKY